VDFYNISVTNNGNVFFVSIYQNYIYKSIDGGSTLTSFLTPGTRAYDIFFTDNANGYYLGQGDLYNTIDGGVNWTKVNTTGLSFASNATSILSSLFFTNTSTGWIVNGANVFKTNGSIQNWVPASFTGIQPTAPFQFIYVTPNNNIYISNRIGELYKSVDGGTTFSLLKLFSSSSLFCDIHFVDDNTGYVSAGNRIYKTTDAGATWNVVVALGEAILIELHFTDAGHGWACGSKGTVLVFN
jgi:photosystem II stability/assembly factor-like uncharacterized protein